MNEFPVKTLGVVIPTGIELKPFADLIPALKLEVKHPWEMYTAQVNGLDLRFIVSYIGPANAAAATERLLAFAPQAILHAGSAGAMNQDLLPGDIVIGSSYKPLCTKQILEVRKSLLLSNKGIRFSRDGEGVHLEQLEADEKLLSIASMAINGGLSSKLAVWAAGGWPKTVAVRSPLAVIGCLGSQDGWTKDREGLDFIRSEFGVECEDMESAFVAQIAAKHRVPFLAVRGISNNEYHGSLEKHEIIPAVREAARNSAIVLTAIIDELARDN